MQRNTNQSARLLISFQITKMKPTTKRRPYASSDQPPPPDEPQRPPPFRPPPEARPRVHPNTTILHAINTDEPGSAARTRPRVTRQPPERCVIQASTRSRSATEPAVWETLPRQTPLSTNARKLPTTRRAPTPREADHKADAATEPRAAQTSTHPAKAQVTHSATQSDLATAAPLQLGRRGTAKSAARTEARTPEPLAERVQEVPATTTPACSNGDGASVLALAKTNVGTTPRPPQATRPTVETSARPATHKTYAMTGPRSAQTKTTVRIESTPVQPEAQTSATTNVESTANHQTAQTTATLSPMAEISTLPTPPITAAEEATPVSEIPGFLEGLVMTRQHFIERSKRTLFFRGRRLALQKLEGDQVLVRYGGGRCILPLFD
ncbi:proteoglycan 4-like [Bactrocera dorsalis]|uniref:Proteoglycan 4-like n=1 Tax=Bactrocera dorsalis TaxID=27457 RepID=A0ABM3JA59_BACDO|nr:proteoglycan 4-like [Bactrocera dorsalis]XP_049306107.1 proteoglycan 4-like [Bactrocera dorsalis]